MLLLWSLLFPLLLLPSALYARSSSADSVLVIIEPNLRPDKFSIFFNNLRARGYNLTFRVTNETLPLLLEDDIPQFGHIIFFTPDSKKYPEDITGQSLITLMSKNTNMLFALSTKKTFLMSLAPEFSLILPPPSTPLISHFPKRNTPPTVVPIDVPKSDPILSSTNAPIWFSGTPQALTHNPRLVPILRAPSESYASDSVTNGGANELVDVTDKGGEGLWAGSQVCVVTGFQARSGARATWVGGVEAFSDEFAKKEISPGIKSGNEDFARDVAAWTFQESLVLRVDNTTHHLVNEAAPKTLYTTNDRIVYNAHISRYNPNSARWEPYSGIDDLQLEFTMLDPHIRTALRPVTGSPGEYSVTFRAPDRHGVFKFVLDYKRKGWSHLYSSTTVSVAPPRHDGYPRFLSSGWPYYAGAISTSIGFLLFSALWLVGDAREPKRAKGSKAE